MYFLIFLCVVVHSEFWFGPLLNECADAAEWTVPSSRKSGKWVSLSFCASGKVLTYLSKEYYGILKKDLSRSFDWMKAHTDIPYTLYILTFRNFLIIFKIWRKNLDWQPIGIHVVPKKDDYVKVFTFFQAALPYSFVQRFACDGVPDQLIRLCHVQTTGQELKIGDKGVKRFPLYLTSSIKFNCRHNRVLLCFEVCFELSDDSFEYVFFTYILCTFSRSNSHSFPLESEVNFPAFVADKAHKVAYFLLLSAFAERSSERKFAMLIKPFPFFTQVRSGPVHSWPVERRIGVSFGHPGVFGSVQWRSKSHYFDTMLHTHNTDAMLDSQLGPHGLMWLVNKQQLNN